MKELSLRLFSLFNRSRSYAIGHNTDTKFDLLYFSNALAGEAGEVCNKVKKQIRDKVNMQREIMMEICDVITYADLLCGQLNCSIEDCMKLKWDEISIRHGMQFRIADAMIETKGEN